MTRAVVVVLPWLLPGVALAQGSGASQAAADALYNEGRALLKAGNRAAACAKFEASLAVAPAASTMINIARCHEQDGRLATAWAEYGRALTLNGDTPGAERRKTLEGLAREGLRALEARLPRLRVVITGAPVTMGETPKPPAGVRVLDDDRILPAETLGEALPADPGVHRIRVRAPGYDAEERTVELQEGRTASVEITLRSAPASRWMRPTGVAFTAVGALGLGLGAATGILSLGKVSAIKTSCGGSRCAAWDTADQGALGTARTLGNVSTAGFVAGGVLAAAGVTLLVLSPASVRVSVGAGRLSVEGSF